MHMIFFGDCCVTFRMWDKLMNSATVLFALSQLSCIYVKSVEHSICNLNIRQTVKWISYFFFLFSIITDIYCFFFHTFHWNFSH